MFFGKGKIVVELVDQHIQAVKESYSYYMTAMEGVLKGCSLEERGSYNRTMRQLESGCDALRHEIIRKMLDGGLLADSRKSIMHIIEQADQVANVAEDILGMLYQEQIQLLPSMTEPIIEMHALTFQQLELLEKAIEQVVYTYEEDTLYDLLRAIERYESDVDKVEKALIQAVFSQGLPLERALHLKQVITAIASVSDLIEDVSDQIEIVMLARKV